MEQSYVTDGNVKFYCHLGQQFGNSFNVKQILNLSSQQLNSLVFSKRNESIYLCKNLCVKGNFSPNRQNQATAQMSVLCFTPCLLNKNFGEGATPGICNFPSSSILFCCSQAAWELVLQTIPSSVVGPLLTTSYCTFVQTQKMHLSQKYATLWMHGLTARIKAEFQFF